MCGIYGSTKWYSDGILRHKLNFMKFRGPDHQEFQRVKKLNGGEVTLGHVRLAIMDIDARSNQPFQYNDNITIVFNGEVYNYKELKRQYLSDVSFRTSSDTEVICAMYQRFGKDCVRYFNGMFAYVIFDKQKNILVGARDRLGKKPFYYYLTDTSFEFSSQLNPIVYGNPFTISEMARKQFLLNGFISDPYCIYSEVSKLRAGQQFVLDLDTFHISIEQYWDIFSNSCGFDSPKNYEEAKEQVRDLLFDSVKLRLNADVPVGMFLSGGIDSSLTSAIVAQFNRNICAYTIGFNEKGFNESAHANNVAQVLGIPIKINYCEGADMLDVVNGISEYFDEPFADNSLIPTSLLAQKTRQDVTVAIGGDGGDELFYGYNNYFVLPTRKKIMRWPNWSRHLMSWLISPFQSYTFWSQFLLYPDLPTAYISQGYYGFSSIAERYDRQQIASNLPDVSYLYSQRGLLAYSDYDIKHYMNSCINTKADRAAMRSSLELRSPIMDYRLAEYSRLLPYDYLYSDELGGKRILKDILFDMVPRDIMERPKSGFAAPIMNWFREDLRDSFIDVVSYNNIMNYLPELDPNQIIKDRDHVLSNMSDNNPFLFKIYTYINWVKNNQSINDTI